MTFCVAFLVENVHEKLATLLILVDPSQLVGLLFGTHVQMDLSQFHLFMA